MCLLCFMLWNAVEKTIPPYVIYKAEHLRSTWTENGLPGTRYNRSKHGWIDLATFEECFIAHLLPILKKQDGRKVLIGNNLSSHLSLKVVKLCEENLCFVFLPPNSSHLIQPLDVAYFRPLEAKWRKVLLKWKQSDADAKTAICLPKDQFPMLLKEVLEELNSKAESKLKAGFKKFGICPVNREEILSRLPETDKCLKISLVGDVFLAHLQQRRQEFVKT